MVSAVDEANMGWRCPQCGYELARLESANFWFRARNRLLAWAIGRYFPAARSLLQLDARRVPFREEFDVVGAFDVIEHIEDDRAVLAGLRASAVPGGGVLVTVPQHPWLWSEYDARAGHLRLYRARELAAKIAEAGLEIVRMTSFVALLLPIMYLSRRAQRARGPGYDPLAELRIAPWANRMLESVLGAERALIRAGVNFPAGDSLLAIARRPA